MRILGVDPGLTRCGLGVVESGAARRVTMLDVRVATSPSTHETPARLAQIATVLEAMLDEHQPEAVAMERIFARSDVSTIMGTAQVSGVIMLAAERRGLPLTLYTPSEVKAAVTGNGRADKAQVTTMVTRLLGLAEAPRPADAADALAIAIAHAWRGGAAPVGSGATTAAQRQWAEAEKAARRRR
ncbi:crossover junction endodeoxyribonuclease RuvC [Demequina sp. SYSU T00192]|uniref:Crossover junction endodeoxyribonuclease RuvC n=1 Tax=Demequina litoralis TaxID=3051660 RepID=A0ABT8G634_9MICO|nr:crossover junction endodeoxyribonuclease RuvC [Demequina sp. SYSU T00192]MDN4474522.1 crossover junction endodeoxyribonuclease RuvC [Demequina sp. SYSU T00192]